MFICLPFIQLLSVFQGSIFRKFLCILQGRQPKCLFVYPLFNFFRFFRAPCSESSCVSYKEDSPSVYLFALYSISFGFSGLHFQKVPVYLTRKTAQVFICLPFLQFLSVFQGSIFRKFLCILQVRLPKCLFVYPLFNLSYKVDRPSVYLFTLYSISFGFSGLHFKKVPVYLTRKTAQVFICLPFINFLSVFQGSILRKFLCILQGGLPKCLFVYPLFNLSYKVDSPSVYLFTLYSISFGFSGLHFQKVPVYLTRKTAQVFICLPFIQFLSVFQGSIFRKFPCILQGGQPKCLFVYPFFNFFRFFRAPFSESSCVSYKEDSPSVYLFALYSISFGFSGLHFQKVPVYLTRKTAQVFICLPFIQFLSVFQGSIFRKSLCILQGGLPKCLFVYPLFNLSYKVDSLSVYLFTLYSISFGFSGLHFQKVPVYLTRKTAQVFICLPFIQFLSVFQGYIFRKSLYIWQGRLPKCLFVYPLFNFFRFFRAPF